ncbi:sigma-70 family RNA polymerase sigma factor [Thalassomonas actiniarum]|uniref:Sigma-70 family RNA polymerase sigma factor n=1 Tax=Thalassomonas actiniarum TaxID=485447 RepID=A0AAF0C4R7_9GAMM|nr:sigma-70 family RNA polymerase sigma factor [Thalassomonas actiniarum]WDE00269.1 sigma-70 family RNA polymerase sigma factor [Thalassomonas actiniarum]
MQVTGAALQKDQEGIKPIAMPADIDNKTLTRFVIAIALKRDKQAFTSLFKFFAPKIKRVAATRFNNNEQVNEVLQETMTIVWRKAHLFNIDKGAVTTWVYTIMRNVSFDMLRKVQASKEDNLSDDIWPLAERNIGEGEVFADHLARKNILTCLEQLPQNQQMVVKGFYFLEMSQEQLARQLDLPLGTIKSRLRLALSKLKLQLGDDNDQASS